MKLLLDTHALPWFLADDPRLSAAGPERNPYQASFYLVCATPKGAVVWANHRQGGARTSVPRMSHGTSDIVLLVAPGVDLFGGPFPGWEPITKFWQFALVYRLGLGPGRCCPKAH
jgi:hypothetical protein